MDLKLNTVVATFTHDSKINWLELNETGTKLLFRDRRLKLYVLDVQTESPTSLLSYCCYVQWIPGSDVVVGQNKTSLYVWYNIDMPDRATVFPVKGEVTGLERGNGRTQVLVQSGVETISYTLDEGLIEFGTAIEDRDYLRALTFLETLEVGGESEAMWKTLGDLSLQDRKLKIAERCFAALGNVAKARYLRELSRLAEQIKAETGEGLSHYLVEAKLAVLNKQFKQAEAILLERGEVDQAMSMYQELHRWEDAIAVAEARSHPDLSSLKAAYYQSLLDSGQEERAGEVREREGDLTSAISLYMKAGLPGKAARLLSQHPELSNQPDLLRHIASSLSETGQFERAGELYERANNLQQAMEAYRRGGCYRRAIELARSAYPTQVVALEEEWGTYLCSRKQYDSAIVHLIEAGQLVKAAEAAILARQWSKAVQIVDMLEPTQATEHYQLLATHFASTRDFPLAEKYFLKAGMSQEAVDMYIHADDWQSAHKVAVDCMPPDQVRELYISQASQLDREGRLAEAEQLYLLVHEPDLAISMYKRAKQFEPMVKLVARYHSDLLTDTHLHLAKELEGEGQLRQAETHYVKAEDWKAAVAMYRTKNLWEDAYRVAKAEGGISSANQVAYLWAKSLGGESAVKLLTKFGLLEAAVDFAVDNFSFDFAFNIARVALKEKIPDIHLKKALYLEDEGKFQGAEQEFMSAGKPKEAVLMYVHQKDWENAQRVAELHCPDSVPDVLIGQARYAFENKHYQQAEAHLLRAEKPDLAAKFYKEADMWQDALRIMKDYLPHKLDEFEQEMTAKGGRDCSELLSQAQVWERSGEHSRAIDTYLLLTPANCPSQDILQDSWEKAVDLAMKFVPSRTSETASMAADRLAKIGRFIQAGELYLSVEMPKQGLDMLISGEAWDKARDIAKNVAPRYERYVEECYVEYLKDKKRPDEMEGVDPGGALKMYAQEGQWDKCLELAEKQGAAVLEKYVALSAAQLVKSSNTLSALALFSKYGAPPNPQNFNLYKHLCVQLFSGEAGNGYDCCAQLRDMLYSLVDAIACSKEAGSSPHREFEGYLLVSHYLCVHAACQTVSELQAIAAKISVALLRYTDLLPADRTFHQAGSQCKAMGWENMAFVFLNWFLDFSEAIEEGSLDMLDNTDFTNTDIPFEVPLPEKPFMAEEEREEVKEWVLAVSLDQQVEQVLPTDERGTYVASLSCPHTGVTSLPCVITGYPVLRQKVEFKKGGRCANKEDWNKFVMAVKVSPTEECLDVWRFLGQWCGVSQNPAYAFH